MDIQKQLIEKTLFYLPAPLRKRIVRAGIAPLQADIENIVLRQAISIEDYIKCFRLLHDVYVEAGFTKPATVPLRIIPHHTDPESKVFLGYWTDSQAVQTLIYTVSLFPDNEQGLPMDAGFKKEVDALRKQGRRIAEVGCLASNPAFRRRDKNIPMLGNRMIFTYAVNHLKADDLLITVHPKHLKIYEDILLFEKLGQISSYAYVNDNPAVALRLNLNNVVQNYKKAYAWAPVGKNLHHFFFDSESKSIDLSRKEKRKQPELIKDILESHALEKLPLVNAG